jgi:hypothetical protein
MLISTRSIQDILSVTLAFVEAGRRLGSVDGSAVEIDLMPSQQPFNLLVDHCVQSFLDGEFEFAGINLAKQVFGASQRR